MQKLTWNDNEKVLVGSELEKLWAFNDKHLTEEKKVFFVNELSLGFPVKAVLLGLKHLQNSDLKFIKMIDIKSASRKFIEKEKLNACVNCSGEGVVSMVDDNDYDYSFSCNCELGIDIGTANKLVSWNGKDIQYIGYKKFTKKWPSEIILTEKEQLILAGLKSGKVPLCPF